MNVKKLRALFAELHKTFNKLSPNLMNLKKHMNFKKCTNVKKYANTH